MQLSNGKRPLRRPRHRWEDNIEMDRVKGCELDLSDSKYIPVTRSCEHVNEYFGSTKGKELLTS
jgi:hypothetical protein